MEAVLLVFGPQILWFCASPGMWLGCVSHVPGGPSTLSCGGHSVVCLFTQNVPAQSGPGTWVGQGPHPPFPRVLGAPESSTQRREHCTVVLTFSTKAVRYVWYSMSVLEFSFFLTGQSRGEGRPACRNGVGALHKTSDASIRAQSSGKATQDLGLLRVAAPYPSSSSDPALHGCSRAAPSGGPEADVHGARDSSLLRNHWVIGPWGASVFHSAQARGLSQTWPQA